MNVLLISGPTAAGKSTAARRLALRLGGEIINADALQVYRELRLLSARPSDEDMAEVPHHLYGHISASRRFSAGAWLKAALAAIEDIHTRGRLPIVVGGTGLYFRCLMQGLAEIPAASAAIRGDLRARLAHEGASALHRALAEVDPDLADRLPLRDAQRILRGLEVFEATGIPLSSWQQQKMPPPLQADFIKYRLLPPREVLDEAADRRIDRMVAADVLSEARALDLPPEMPAMKALGLRDFRAHLAGEISLDEAIAHVKLATRQYIRRQLTWIRTQMADWIEVNDEKAFHAITPATLSWE